MRIALALLCLATAPGAAAQAESLVLACPVCHGAPPPAAAARAPSAVPSFYGQPADEIAWQLREFRAGSREGSAMTRLTRSLTDDEIDSLARTFGVTLDRAR